MFVDPMTVFCIAAGIVLAGLPLSVAFLIEQAGGWKKCRLWLERWLFLQRYARKCPKCGRKGFAHSWQGIPIPEQIARVHQGTWPTDARCHYCGFRGIPIVSPATTPTGAVWGGQWFLIPPDVYEMIRRVTKAGGTVYTRPKKLDGATWTSVTDGCFCQAEEAEQFGEDGEMDAPNYTEYIQRAAEIMEANPGEDDQKESP